MYRGPCTLKPPIEPAKYGIKVKVVLKWRAIYIESIRVGSQVELVDGLKMEGFVKWRGLNRRYHCTPRNPVTCRTPHGSK